MYSRDLVPLLPKLGQLSLAFTFGSGVTKGRLGIQLHRNIHEL